MWREGSRVPSLTIRALIILCQDFEESLRVLTDRTPVGSVFSLEDVATIPAVPLRRRVFLKHFPFGDILQQIKIALFMGLLDLGDL